MRLVGLTARTLRRSVSRFRRPCRRWRRFSRSSIRRSDTQLGCAPDARHERHRCNLHPVHRWGDRHLYRSVVRPPRALGDVQRPNVADLIVGDVFCRPMHEALDEAAEAGTPYDLRQSVRSRRRGDVEPGDQGPTRPRPAQESPLVTNDSSGPARVSASPARSRPVTAIPRRRRSARTQCSGVHRGRPAGRSRVGGDGSATVTGPIHSGTTAIR